MCAGSIPAHKPHSCCRHCNAYWGSQQLGKLTQLHGMMLTATSACHPCHHGSAVVPAAVKWALLSPVEGLKSLHPSGIRVCLSVAAQANNAAGQSWEGSARWDSLAALGVAPPPAGAQSWHDWGTPGVSKTGWLSVRVTDSLGLQVRLPGSSHRGAVTACQPGRAHGSWHEPCAGGLANHIMPCHTVCVWVATACHQGQSAICLAMAWLCNLHLPMNDPCSWSCAQPFCYAMLLCNVAVG